MFQHVDHRIVRIGRLGVGQLDGGGPPQPVPQTPLGQFEVVVDVAHLNGGPFPSVTFLQGRANQIDVGRLNANLAVAQIDDVKPLLLGDASFDGLAVAEDEYPLAG